MVAAVLVGVGGAAVHGEEAKPAAGVTGAWSGWYVLPSGRIRDDLGVVFGPRTTIALGPGHATHTVAPRMRGSRVRFSVPGRPAPVVFDGRLRGRRITGTVRQGNLRGSFELGRAGSGRAARVRLLGAYAGGGGTLVVSEYPPALSSYPTAPFRVTELPSGETRGLFGSGTAFVRGDALGVRGAATGRVRFAADGSALTWVDGTRAVRLALRQQEVRFPGDGGVTLAGTLTLPAGAGPHAAVVLVHGSGGTPRGLFQPFDLFFASRGLAVLAYDKRGAGQSGGVYDDSAGEAMLDRLARDAEAALRYAVAQPEIDPRRVGLWGISQAGWLIPLAASRSAAAFAAINVGPAVTVGEQIFYGQLTTFGVTPPAEPLDALNRRLREEDHRSGLDPLPSIRRLRVPALWLLGGLDHHVPTARTVELLAQVKGETGADLSWEVFPRGQHFLIEGERGLLDEIPRSQRYVPGLFEAIERWLRAKGFSS